MADDEFDQWIVGDSQRCVGDDDDSQRVAFGDSIDLIFDGAGVSVHEEGQHGDNFRGARFQRARDEHVENVLHGATNGSLRVTPNV